MVHSRHDRTPNTMMSKRRQIQEKYLQDSIYIKFKMSKNYAIRNQNSDLWRGLGSDQRGT